MLPRHPLESLEQRDLVAVGERDDRVARRIERAGAAHVVERGYGRLALTADGARRGRGLRERVEADIVGIREGGFFTRYRADTDAAVDRIRSRLDDALLEAPAFESRILEVEIRVIDVMDVDIGEYLRELPEFERRWREQELRRLVEQRGIESGNGEIGHGNPCWIELMVPDAHCRGAPHAAQALARKRRASS